MDSRPRIVIVGGGIAGVTCLETLLAEYSESGPLYESITLITESKLVKKVVNYTTRGRNLENFDVVTEDATGYLNATKVPDSLNFNLIIGQVDFINSEEQRILVNKRLDHSSTIRINYDILCLCNGSSPDTLAITGTLDKNIKERILTVRDTTSVKKLQHQLVSSKKIAIIGNGGIALELVNRLKNCQITWIIRDDFIGHPFLDSEASKFFVEMLGTQDKSDPDRYDSINSNKDDFYEAIEIDQTTLPGPALGPHWLQNLSLKGNSREGEGINILYRREVDNISYNESSDHPLRILIRDDEPIDCDIIVSAIGVKPNNIIFTAETPETSADDGGIVIDDQMRTSIKHIYAAGDVVSCVRWPKEKLWFQMRLWTQARQMGYYCGKCVIAHLTDRDPAIYSNFECFTHVTSFFGHKLVLLGRYNGQFLNENEVNNYEAIVRINRRQDYMKLLLIDSKVIGAILVGETNLEETIENLIYDQVDVSDIKNQLLDDTVDIEDYFD